MARSRDRLRDALAGIAGPRHPGLKLAAALLAAMLLVVGFWRTDYRVAARTVIEGSTQLAAVAPFDGFIAEAYVRAGDTVTKGQPLARLDDRDLRLERSRWLAEREQLQRKRQVAMAQGDRGAMGVLAAQIDQAEAQLALAEERSRARSSPRRSTASSSPAISASRSARRSRQGKLLFEVAPLDGYRVVLQVDDRDIVRLADGQRGELVLSSLPGRALPFTVSPVTPVATQRDGRNVFRVEAALDGEPPRGLRPGMEGVGKVDVGQRSLLWIWTHGFVDWLRLALWNWLP